MRRGALDLSQISRLRRMDWNTCASSLLNSIPKNMSTLEGMETLCRQSTAENDILEGTCQVNIYSRTNIYLSSAATLAGGTVDTSYYCYYCYYGYYRLLLLLILILIILSLLLLLLTVTTAVTHRAVLLGGVLELELRPSLGFHGDAQLEGGGHGRLLLQLVQT